MVTRARPNILQQGGLDLIVDGHDFGHPEGEVGGRFGHGTDCRGAGRVSCCSIEERKGTYWYC